MEWGRKWEMGTPESFGNDSLRTFFYDVVLCFRGRGQEKLGISVGVISAIYLLILLLMEKIGNNLNI